MTEDDAAVLHAEMAALQAVLIAVLRRVATNDPQLTQSLCAAFDEAETVLTGLAVQLGGGISGPTTLSALRVVEEIRSGVLEAGACFNGEGPDPR